MDNYLMYLRKSRQDSPFETVEEVLARHEQILQDFAMRVLGHNIPEEYIFREIVSGETISNRPVMQELLARIESPTVSGVIVVDPQRLSRGDLTDCGTLMTSFKYSRTNIITPVKTYDLWEKFDEKVFRDELLRGREYLEYAKEVMTRGRKLSQTEGWFVGGIVPFGYDRLWVKIGAKERPTLTPNPEEANAVRIAFESFVYLRMSTVQIADKLNNLGYKPRRANRFTSQAISQMLQNDVYIGVIVVGKRPKKETLVNGQIITSRPRSTEYMTFPGRHQQLISEELFEMARERLGTLPRIKKHAELKNPFASLLYCSCGHCMHLAPARGKPRMICNNSKYCGSRSISYETVLEEVIFGFKKYAEDFEMKVSQGADAGNDKYEAELERLKTALNDCDLQQDRLFTFLENGTYSEDMFKERYRLLTKRKEELQARYEEFVSQAPPEISYEEMTGTLYEVIDALSSPTLSAKQKNDFLKEIIDKIIYTPQVVNDGSRWGQLNYDIDIFLKNIYTS